MSQGQLFHLTFTEDEVKGRDSFSARKRWKMLLGSALHQRASEVLLLKKANSVRLICLINGQYREMAAPPITATPSMIDDMIDASRPRGWRVWVIRTLRSLIRWLEGSYGSQHSAVTLLGKDKTMLINIEQVEIGEEQGLRLRFDVSAELAIEARDIMRDYFTRQGVDLTRSEAETRQPQDVSLHGEVPQV